MTNIGLFFVKNAMLFANGISNVIGVCVVLFVSYRTASTPSPEVEELAQSIHMVFLPCSFIVPIILTVLYEGPIRRWLNIRYRKQPMLPDISIKARRRLLNEPFFLIGLDFSIWLISGVLYSAFFWAFDAGQELVRRPFFLSLEVGLITVVVAFFVLEHVLQKRMVPHFFPDGGLYMTPKTLRIRIRTRLAAFLFACNLVPFFAILNILRETSRINQGPAQILELLRSAIFINAFLFMGVGIWLTILVSGNLTRLLKEIIRVLQGVRNGHFDRKVRVTSNDEIGYTGDVINEMTEGLKERDRMRHSLDLAMEVQSHLMPKTDPKIEGLDIAGKSIYCDKTGGDYYDYLNRGERDRGKIGIVVGDVSEHGVPSALLMTTARAFVRQRSSMPGTIARIVSDVNRQLSQDVEDTGRFMTLFYSEIDTHNQCIRWVNAGHDPAIIYDPGTDSFDELAGRSLPLGVFEDSRYTELQRNITSGQIIVIGTDGIWEAHNPRGEMFGKDTLREVIHGHARGSAKEILDAVIDEVEQFSHPLQKEDDVTLVVVKVLQQRT